MKILGSAGGGSYVKGPGGTIDYGSTMSVKINGKELYNSDNVFGSILLAKSLLNRMLLLEIFPWS